ncbi:MAG TPA: SEC-C domain-containing protein [Alcanivoracaceae bacterium]|nr:SEC-C domain-containing protein [Alcanivoracaceae bacterium]
MKLGRNTPCPCGSEKKYKRCCMNSIAQQQAALADDIAQAVAMNPSLSIDELNLVAQRKIEQRNHQPHADFCGLTSTQMQNWLYAPLDELIDVTINTPSDLSDSPVMRYLALILDEAMQQGGSFKATAKGNLPVKLVKQATALLPEFTVAELETVPSISEYQGHNEDQFNALHYTRVLAEIAGVIYHRSGAFHVKKTAQKQYQAQGLHAFFLPMLDAAVSHYNWGYFDSFDDQTDLRLFWLFMLWRLQQHGSANTLITETARAFPALLEQMPVSHYHSATEQLHILINTRFMKRFLQYWGFITAGPRLFLHAEDATETVTLQPLLRESFVFSV